MHQVLACKSTLARQASSEHHECSGMICSRHMGEHSVARRTIKQCTGLMMMGWGCYQSCHKSMTQKLAHEQMHTAPYSRSCWGAQCIYVNSIQAKTQGVTPCGTPTGQSGTPGIVQQTHLLEELLLQLVRPALVCRAVCRQVANISALQHHLHQCNNIFTFATILPFITILPLWYTDDMSHGSTFGSVPHPTTTSVLSTTAKQAPGR